MLCAFNDQINNNFHHKKNLIDHRAKGVDQCRFLTDNQYKCLIIR
ncbi:MAG: hypothetical protein JWR54_2593 [Mucilaginibacter sp.]|nr:hypothetical protein [Mucilaginibacter sp.]